MSWGPRLVCDGTGLPAGFDRIEGAQVLVETERPGREPAGWIGPDWPGLFWTWRRCGWFGLRRRRVCHDPGFAPVVALRLWVPPALAQLRALAADPGAVPIFSPVSEGRDA